MESLNFNKESQNERAEEQDRDRRRGGYGGDYFDENEHRAGQEKYDLATGKKYKNDGNIKPIGVVTVSEKDLTGDDPIVKELTDDITTRWFLENGMDKFGNPINKGNSEDIAA